MRAWLVRAGRDGEREAYALGDGRTIAGWEELPDLTGVDSKRGIRAAIEATYPDESNALVGNWTGQLDRFINQMAIGDIVAMPRKGEDKVIALGRIESGYEFLAENDPGFQHTRRVDWVMPDLERASIHHDLLASMGALLTICELERNHSADRLDGMLNGEPDPGPHEASARIASLEELPAIVPVTTSIRELLNAAGLQRRTAGTVDALETKLLAMGLETSIPIDDGLIDDEITISVLPVSGGKRALVEEARGSGGASPREIRVGYRVSAIPSASLLPLFVTPTDPLSVAQTHMLEKNYSQLAVVDNGALVGAVTWESIAVASISRRPELVGDARVVSPPMVSPRQNVLEIRRYVEQHGYVFVSGADGQIGGIVTLSDLAAEFGRDRRPLMLVEEIELRIRRAVQAHFTDEEIASSPARAKRVSELTLGAYPHLLENESDWLKLQWSGVEHSRVLELVKITAGIRNNLMHFSQDPIEDSALEDLEGLLRLLRAIDRDPGDSLLT
ncbi:CBS domain-containing protein [Pseudoclavibacter sp. VKM Ac-2888]|uniref:CBS domain-containing protein n=1 Tax=Pseudoclavibacter sp. VKM Ac-2888 TaxID=2783830 RepID=UPI00188BCAFD|nr:CBS domain-containing protein [Pseudoclavibacter sp. VKM Ac-2888]MBF4549907.1 CBS domain-containing protein [Pseudoclavibacter sp. VKM Ac-2888]